MWGGSPRTVILPLPETVAFPKQACLVPSPAWFSHRCTWTAELNISVFCSVWGSGTEPPQIQGLTLQCAFCCLSQTKHQEKPKGGFGIKCPPDGVNKRL